VRLPTTVLSLRASVRRFEPTRVPNSLDVPITTDYDLFEVGITVNPRSD
jgi:hypothetical protein